MTSLFRKVFNKQNGNIKKELETVCPHCKNIISQKIQRKKRCPFCGNDIYVRSKQKIFSSSFLNKEDAVAMDWLKKLEDFGIKDNDFINKRKELSEKFRKEAKSTDVIWSLFNKLILKTKDLCLLKAIYYNMALFLNEGGKDCFAILQQSAKMELMRFKQEDFIEKVKILTTGKDSCKACQRLENKIFTIKEAIEKMPIPCKECTHKIYNNKKSFCRCCYSAKIE